MFQQPEDVSANRKHIYTHDILTSGYVSESSWNKNDAWEPLLSFQSFRDLTVNIWRQYVVTLKEKRQSYFTQDKAHVELDFSSTQSHTWK